MAETNNQIFKDAKSFSNMSVIVVDNVDNIRTTVATMLTEAGFKKVYSATNGIEALDMITQHKINVVISEWQLPKMNGVELLRKLRLDSEDTNIPFIMMSSTIEHVDVIRAIRNGVSEYVVKPFSANILLERIKRAIQSPIKSTASLIRQKSQNENVEMTRPDKLSVLVVDDEPINIQVLSDILKDEFKIKAATTGNQAINICLSDTPPDLILLDIMMPNLSGLEVCKRLKANPKTQHIAIIFVSALSESSDLISGLEYGAIDYITKPIHPGVTKARIKAHAKGVLANKVIKEQVETLSELNRLRDEFDRVIKNDLKQPLHEIQSSLEIAKRYCNENSKLSPLLCNISVSSIQMEAMIDDMLTLIQIEDGNYTLTPVINDLHKILATMLDNFRTSIRQKMLAISYEHTHVAQFYGESRLTLSALSNLFKNACEAAPNGSAITIGVKQLEDFICVSINNSGFVAEDIHDRFFDKYVTFGKKNASGIGTYAAKLMIDIQHGKVEFTTSEVEGTTLTVFLPLS